MKSRLANVWKMGVIGVIGAIGVLAVSCAKKPQPQTYFESEKIALPDSARVKAMLSVSQNNVRERLSAVLFAVPNERYRLELSGTFGLSAASILWKQDGWKVVIPQEERYMEGKGNCVSLPVYDSVDIHKLALLFFGQKVNGLDCDNSGNHLNLEYKENFVLIHFDNDSLKLEIRNIDQKAKWGSGVWNLNIPEKYTPSSNFLH
ncbi:MAG: hypothetical protein LBC85_07255 [Fibromonadaceae bacterium]|jgi:hypothetical protein|nr:hypothetical protein [Fibromonadaceae bacterium]